MKDQISRQLAIDVMNGHFETLKQAWGSRIKKDEVAVAMYIDMRSIIEALPSTQPEIIRCKDCKFWLPRRKQIAGRCKIMGLFPSCDWYCANAERREGGAE